MITGVQATKLRVLLVSGLLSIASANFLSAQTIRQASKDSGSDQAQPVEGYGKHSVNAAPNADQNETAAESISSGRGYGLNLTSDGPAQARNKAAFAAQPVAVAWRSGHAHRQVAFAGDSVVLTIGSTGRGSEAGVPADQDSLPDVVKQSAGDYLFYSGNQRLRENSFAMATNADPNSIQVQLSDVTKLKLEAGSDLVASANEAEFVVSKPVTYQQNDGRHDWLRGHFALGKRYRVNLSLGGDAPPQPLVNDPVVANSTSLGSSQSDKDAAYALAVD
jgi:hypothetical protein